MGALWSAQRSTRVNQLQAEENEKGHSKLRSVASVLRGGGNFTQVSEFQEEKLGEGEAFAENRKGVARFRAIALALTGAQRMRRVTQSPAEQEGNSDDDHTRT